MLGLEQLVYVFFVFSWEYNQQRAAVNFLPIMKVGRTRMIGTRD